MRLNRVIHYLNWLIGLALLALTGAAVWWAWRPLPTTSGRTEAPVSGPATVTRDDLGVPHIKAASIDDALFLQGYVTAQDRLWQMDALRRYASGQLSEIIGRATIETDRESRRLRMRRLAEEHAGRLSAEDYRAFAAYARGVNHFIERHRDRLPLEFTMLKYQPRHWTVADTIAIGMQMHRDLTTSWKADMSRAAMYSSGGDPRLITQLFPERTGLELQPGSNAWVVSGKHTATGKPILANDPHLEWGVPSTWYMVHLQAPELNVAGATLPGAPAVIIGHNERIAWGVTNLHFDVQDLYVDRIDPQTGHYVHGGRIEQARTETELIPVKGASPVEFTNRVTRHGPVWNSTGAASLTLRWTAAEPGKFEFPFLDINRARNWTEFRGALRRFHGPGQNFVYADVDGNIGYQATGALPIRRGFNGSVPVDGSTGKFEWEGYIPFDDLPSIYNPPDGRIVTANQNPFPADWKYPVSGEFDPGYRARQIRDLLSAREGWKSEDMIAVQKDVYSPFLHLVAKEAAKAKGVDPVAARLLREWNGQVDKDLAAPMIAQLTYTHLRQIIAKRAAGRVLAWDGALGAAIVERLLRERPTEWFSDWDVPLREAVRDALEEGRTTQGRDPEAWKYGAFISLELKHPVVSQIPWIGNWFNVGPTLMSGSSTTVKQTSRRLGPSMRFVADLSDWDRSLANVTLGQSGHVLSGHFKDQWKSYWAGKSFPFRWSNVDGDVLHVQPGK